MKRRKYRLNKKKLCISLSVVLTALAITAGSIQTVAEVGKKYEEEMKYKNILTSNIDSPISFLEKSLYILNASRDGQSTYNYSDYVPQNQAVDASFFNDALFIGDLRAEGIKLYSILENAELCTARNLSVLNISDKKMVSNASGERKTIPETLESRKFGKIYIMLGTNELSSCSEKSFVAGYQALISRIKRLQPAAQIYLHTIIAVGEEKSNAASGLCNNKIKAYNELILKIAEDKKVYVVNAAAVVANEAGVLPEEASVDGVNLNREYYLKWYDYIRTHTVSKNTKELN